MSQYIQDFRAGRPFGDGTDGNLTISTNTTFGAGTSCSGTSGTTTLTLGAAGSFADNDLIIIHQSRGTGAGGWEVNRIASGGGTTTLTLATNLANTYTDSGASQAQAVRLLEYNNVTVNNGVTWSVPAWDGDKGGILAFAARGTVTITGTISGDGLGHRGGQLQASGGNVYSGESSNQDRTFQDADTDGSGGGVGGAGGGNGTAGTNGEVEGVGGEAVGNAALTTALFGGGGGAGTSPNEVNGAGGDGGGLVLIFGKNVTITGGITNDGANGDAGSSGGGGGGGAGGSVLIKSQIATLGTTKITATAGSGGAAGQAGKTTGQAGGVGRIRLDYSSSYTGTTTPTLSAASDGALLETDAGFIFNLL